MTISAVLARKGNFVATILPEATIGQLVADLCRHRVGALVVSRDGVTLAGIVSERDVIRGLGTHGAQLMQMAVSTIMTTEVRSCAPTNRVVEVMALMTDGRFRHVPVLVDSRLVGIVSIGDIVRHRINEIEAEAAAMREYIVGQ